MKYAMEMFKTRFIENYLTNIKTLIKPHSKIMRGHSQSHKHLHQDN